MEDRSGLLERVIIVFLVLSWTFTALRCYTRIFVKSRFLGVDDIFAVAALLCFTGYSAVLFCMAQHVGLGRHVTDTSTEVFFNGVRLLFISEQLFGWATFLIKIAFSITLLQVTQNKWQRRIIFGIISICVAFAVFACAYNLTICHPLSKLWSSPSAHVQGTCRNLKDVKYLIYAHGVVLCLLDVILAILPVFLVHKLNLNFRTKASVVFLLAIGSVACVATIARLCDVVNFGAKDIFWAYTMPAIWFVVEVGISIITTSAATLRPLFIRTGFHSLLGSGRVRELPLNAISTATTTTTGEDCSREGLEERDLKRGAVGLEGPKIERPRMYAVESA